MAGKNNDVKKSTDAATTYLAPSRAPVSGRLPAPGHRPTRCPSRDRQSVGGEGVEERKKREERVSYCPERGRAFKQTAAAAAASAAVMLPAPGVREHGSKCQTRKRITLTEA